MESNMKKWSIGQKALLPWKTRLLDKSKKNIYERMIGSDYICIREASDEHNGILLRVLDNAQASRIMFVSGQPFFKDEREGLLNGNAYSSYSTPTLAELKEALAILRSNPSLLAHFEEASMPINLDSLFWVNATARKNLFTKIPLCYNPSADSLCIASDSAEPCRLTMVYFNTQFQLLDFVTGQADATKAESELLLQQTSGMTWKKWVLPAVLIMAVMFYGGYLTGKYSNDQKDINPDPVENVLAKEEVPKATTPVKEEVAETKAPVKEEVAETKAPVKEEVAETKAPVKEEISPSQQEELPELDQYEAKDLRVRIGAYRIVGTDRVVKARAGDDVPRISKRFFGPRMECYIEVYNDIKPGTPLKAGQPIKIPKLVRKKKSEIRR
jgi:hypothetical protein